MEKKECNCKTVKNVEKLYARDNRQQEIKNKPVINGAIGVLLFLIKSLVVIVLVIIGILSILPLIIYLTSPRKNRRGIVIKKIPFIKILN